MNRAARWLLGLFVVILAAFFAASLSFGLGAGQPYKERVLDAAVDVLTSLLVVALLLERSLAVVNSLIWGEEQRGLEMKLLGSKTLALSNPDAKRLAEIMTNRERLRLLLGFVAALFVSAAGIRTLEGLVDLNNPNSLFYPFDVLLTAGLLAGGSNGLAFLIQFLKDMMTRDPSVAARTIRSRLVTTT